MLIITKENNSIKVVGQNNPTYPYSGTLVYPLNSVTVVTDQSDMAVFRSALNNDVLFTGLIENITIAGSPVTKEDIGTKFGAIANSSGSGGGGTGGGAVDSVNGQTGTVVLTAADVNAYSKAETDEKLRDYTPLEAYATEIASIKKNMGNKADKSSLDNYLLKTDAQANYQAKLTAGTGIEITGENVINVTLDTNIYQVVESLPDSDINPNKIYLVLNSESGESDLYIEYLYVNNKWEKIGEYKADVDLTPYLTKADAANTYQPKGEYLTSIPEEYVTETELEGKGYALNTSLEAEVTERQKQDSALGGMIAGETQAREQAINNLTATVQEKLDASTYNADKATFALKSELQGKQDTLVSGTNIKTINSQSLLGEGNIEITVEGGGITDAPSDDKLYGRKNAQWTEVVIPDTSDLATKSELEAKLDVETYNSDKATFALKSEVPKQYVQSFTGTDTGFQILQAGSSDARGGLTFSEGFTVNNSRNNPVVSIDTETIATKAELQGKQDTLVSGTNIKTVNGNSLLGSGNITIESGGSGIATWDYAQIQSDQEYRTNFLSNVKVSDDLTNLGGSDNPEHASILTIDGNVYTVMYNVGGNPKVASINIQESVATITNIDAIPKNYATTEQLNGKQDVLVSGTNIKTVNGNSLLGSGDITIEGGGSGDIPTLQEGEEGTTNNYIYSDSGSTSYRAISYATIGTVNQKLYLRGRYWGMSDNTSINLSISAIPEASSNSNGLLSIADKSKLDTMPSQWFGTQSQFDEVVTKDENTLYFITEE